MELAADALYEPHVGDLDGLLTDVQAERLLLMGGDEVRDLPCREVRRCTPPSAMLPNGVYVFATNSGPAVLLVRHGLPPAIAASSDWDAMGDGDPLGAAWDWFEFFWPQAAVVGPGPQFANGDWVVVAGNVERHDVGRVEDHVRHDDTWVYTVMIDGRPQRIAEAGLLPYDVESDDIAGWLKSDPATARELTVGLTVTKLTNPLTDTIYSYLSSKTVFRPYQFRPVLRLLDSPHQRLLIADEVGLGKTIEAGLVWTELEARNRDMRLVLIVCPSALAPKWQSEMRRRFDRDVRILDKQGLVELVQILQKDDPTTRMAAIVSIERLRSSRLLADMVEAQPDFDLIIVDEAHYLRNKGTLTHDLGQVLTEWADTLIFLSATPLNLGTEDLFNLLNLLVEDEFGDAGVFPLQVEPNRYLNAVAAGLLEHRDSPREMLPTLVMVSTCQLGAAVVNRPEYNELIEILSRDALDWAAITDAKRCLAELHTLSSVLTRTRKVDVPDAKAVREPVQITVEWTPEERNAYRAVREWAIAHANADGVPLGFALQMPLRQAASCLPAARDRLVERSPMLLRPLIDDDFDDFNLDAPPDGEVLDLSDGSLGFAEIADALSRLGDTDTKFDRFQEVLEAAPGWGKGQVLVFSFFRKTLSYLKSRLEPRWRVRIMRGDTPPADRQKIMDDFRAGEFDILLASEVASEGLDFEFCNVIVNYDLPWNPMKVEQRIGRLDRFGQQHEKIFVLNFHVPGTIETDIFERLYRRINVFHESIGELEPILRDQFDELTRVALDPRLSDEQRQTRLGEIEVAVEARQRDLTRLEESQGLLTGIDQLLIDGFEQDTTSRGRFVGPGELRVLLEEFVDDGTRAKLRPVRGSDRISVIGDDVLADRVARWGVSGAGSKFDAIELSRLLRDEEPVVVTFDNQDASRTDVDLVSLRHPLVRAAVRHFEQRPYSLKRFASVQLGASDLPSGAWLVAVHMARTTGVKPSLELWPIALDLTTGEQAEEIGYAFLAGVAHGTLRDGPRPDVGRLEPLLRQAERLLHDRQLREEQRRRAANEALVDARVATQRASYGRRIARVTDTLNKVEKRGRSRSVVRLNEGRVANLKAKRDQVVDDLNLKRQLALVTTPVALAQVTN